MMHSKMEPNFLPNPNPNAPYVFTPNKENFCPALLDYGKEKERTIPRSADIKYSPWVTDFDNRIGLTQGTNRSKMRRDQQTGKWTRGDEVEFVRHRDSQYDTSINTTPIDRAHIRPNEEVKAWNVSDLLDSWAPDYHDGVFENKTQDDMLSCGPNTQYRRPGEQKHCENASRFSCILPCKNLHADSSNETIRNNFKSLERFKNCITEREKEQKRLTQMCRRAKTETARCDKRRVDWKNCERNNGKQTGCKLRQQRCISTFEKNMRDDEKYPDPDQVWSRCRDSTGRLNERVWPSCCDPPGSDTHNEPLNVARTGLKECKKIIKTWRDKVKKSEADDTGLEAKEDFTKMRLIPYKSQALDYEYGLKYIRKCGTRSLLSNRTYNLGQLKQLQQKINLYDDIYIPDICVIRQISDDEKHIKFVRRTDLTEAMLRAQISRSLWNSDKYMAHMYDELNPNGCGNGLERIQTPTICVDGIWLSIVSRKKWTFLYEDDIQRLIEKWSEKWIKTTFVTDNSNVKTYDTNQEKCEPFGRVCSRQNPIFNEILILIKEFKTYSDQDFSDEKNADVKKFVRHLKKLPPVYLKSMDEKLDEQKYNVSVKDLIKEDYWSSWDTAVVDIFKNVFTNMIQEQEAYCPPLIITKNGTFDKSYGTSRGVLNKKGVKFIMETPFVLEKVEEKEVYKVGLPPQLIKRIIRRAGARRDNSPIWEEDPSVESHLKVPYLHNRIDYPNDNDEQEINTIYRKAQNIRKSLKGVAKFSQNRIWQYKINSVDCTRNHIVEVTWDNEKQEQTNLQNEADNQQELQRLKAYEAAARESSNAPNIIPDDVRYANQLAQAADESYNRLRNANAQNNPILHEARQYVLNTRQYANSAFNRLHGIV